MTEIKPKMVDGEPICVDGINCPRRCIVHRSGGACFVGEGASCAPGIRQQRDDLKKENAELKSELTREYKINKNLEVEKNRSRRLELDGAEAWRWGGDGGDDLKSMGDTMAILIRASDLRSLLKTENAELKEKATALLKWHDEELPKWNEYISMNLVRTGRTTVEGAKSCEKEVQELRAILDGGE